MFAEQFLDYAPNRKQGQKDADSRESGTMLSFVFDQVNPQVCYIRGRANSQMTIIDTADGLLVIDCFLRPEATSEALHQYFASHNRKPIQAIIMTRASHNRLGGMTPLIEYVTDEFRMVAPSAWVDQHDHFDELDIDAYEFSTMCEPTDIIYDTPERLELAGLQIDVVPNIDKRGPADILFHIPSMDVGTLQISDEKH